MEILEHTETIDFRWIGILGTKSTKLCVFITVPPFLGVSISWAKTNISHTSILFQDVSYFAFRGFNEHLKTNKRFREIVQEFHEPSNHKAAELPAWHRKHRMVIRVWISPRVSLALWPIFYSEFWLLAEGSVLPSPSSQSK